VVARALRWWGEAVLGLREGRGPPDKALHGGGNWWRKTDVGRSGDGRGRCRSGQGGSCQRHGARGSQGEAVPRLGVATGDEVLGGRYLKGNGGEGLT
jgi:hypothetical protein